MRIKLYIYLHVFAISIALYSCNFNKAFLHPKKSQLVAIPIESNIPGKELVIKFHPINYKPFILLNEIDTLDFGVNIESYIIKKPNNANLNGWLLKPKDQEPIATIFNFHGNSGNLYEQFATLTPLVIRGFQIFMFDYSGFGFSEGQSTRENTLEDSKYAIEFALNQTHISKTKIIFYGQSYGAHLAASIAHIYQKKIEALVIEGAFDSPKSIAAYRAGFVGRFLTKTIFSGIDSIYKFHKPILIIHSKDDKTVPIRMGKKYYNSANTPKEMFIIEKPHLLGPTIYPEEIKIKLLQILNDTNTHSK